MNYKEKCFKRLEYTNKYSKYNQEDLIDEIIEKDKEIEKLNKSLEEQRHFYLEKLQQKENIIKEVREFIYKCNDGKQGINYSGCSKLLEILDKAGDEK